MVKRLTQQGPSKCSKGKQTTLFQTWGYEGNVSLNTPLKSHPGTEKNTLVNSELMDDNDDDALSKALDEEFDIQETYTNLTNHCDVDHTTTCDTVNMAIPSATPLETLPGFDVAAGKTWIYPTNMSVRKYQIDIVQACLYENTLVCLPTGPVSYTHLTLPTICSV